MPYIGGELNNVFHMYKISKKGDEEVVSPINSQQKLDEIKLILVDAKSGVITVEHPYLLTDTINSTTVVGTSNIQAKEEDK